MAQIYLPWANQYRAIGGQRSFAAELGRSRSEGFGPKSSKLAAHTP
jgi:hypothetical protein